MKEHFYFWQSMSSCWVLKLDSLHSLSLEHSFSCAKLRRAAVILVATVCVIWLKAWSLTIYHLDKIVIWHSLDFQSLPTTKITNSCIRGILHKQNCLERKKQQQTWKGKESLKWYLSMRCIYFWKCRLTSERCSHFHAIS